MKSEEKSFDWRVPAESASLATAATPKTAARIRRTTRRIMSTATWIRDELDRRGISYEETHHPDAFTAQEVAHQEHVSGHRVAKVVCVMPDGRPVELVLPAARRVDLDRVRELLGAAEVRLATEAEMVDGSRPHRVRDRFGDRSILDGFPAKLVATLTEAPSLPGWALPLDAVAALRRVER